MAIKKEYTAEEKVAYNEKKKQDIEEMFKRIDEGVKAVFESEKYKEYLKFASKFTDYSARNTMLINMQRPDATLVAAYGKWKQLGRHVQGGESGISILAPVTYKTNQVMEIDKPVVDEYGNQLYNEDGTEKTETVEKALTGLAFKKVYVFDVSQTDGKELPEPVTELSGDIDAARKEAIFTALKKVTGIDIEFKDIRGGAKGYYSPTSQKIVIKTGMSDAQTLKTAFHEAAHSLLHDPDKKIVTAKSPRNEKEVQAESVAFIVAEKFGMDTSEYSFPYIASWSNGKQLEQLKSALQEIQSAAKTISAEIESELLKMQKRHLSMADKLADTELNNIQKAEFMIEFCHDSGVDFSDEDTKKILDFAGSHDDISETVKLVSDMEQIQKQRDSYGYDFTNMTPIDTKEEALAAFDRGEAVYLLYPDNTEGMAESREEIENFGGYFGIEKEQKSIADIADDLIPVSKETALEMWDNDLDVYVDGVRAENREQVENAPDTAKFYIDEFQYTAQLDFEIPTKSNVQPPEQQQPKQPEAEKEENPNIIGNTPYNELGKKGELWYYPNMKNKHAENVARQLDEDGIRYSGLKKGTVTTITINKADIPRYEAAVEKVKAMYDKARENPSPKTVKPGDIAKAIDKAILDNNYELYHYDLKKAATAVVSEYGAEAVNRVLAEYVKNHGYDGRISEKNKEWAKTFDLPENRYPPVFKTHPTVLDGFISETIKYLKERELSQQEHKAPENKLSSRFDDKLLYSSERVELRDDHRGIPETKRYNSSVNEYFIPEIGWMNDAQYDREQRMSGLTAKDFYERVTVINANYIDSTGKTGQVDMSREEYTLLNEKTYSPENAEALKQAKANLNRRIEEAGVSIEKPVEYYAVRLENNRKYSVVTIGEDGDVKTVKPEIATIAEAKKAILEVFEAREGAVKCELVHPQTLEEKAAEIRKNISAVQEKEAKPKEPDFAIYQVKRGEEFTDYRFEPLDRLLKHGKKPEFQNYEKVYEGDFSMLRTQSDNIGEKLEAVFEKFNIDRPEDFKGHSLSVSDVVVMHGKSYYCDDVGFKQLRGFVPKEIKQEKTAGKAHTGKAPEEDKPKTTRKPKL